MPAKLTARVRVLDTGQGRKTDAVDAHAVTAVALSTRGLRELSARDGQVAALRVLIDRRDELSSRRAATLNRLHRLLAELVPGGAGRHLSPLQAKAMLATVRPRDPGGAMRRRIAADLLVDLFTVDAQLKAVTAELRRRVRALGSHLMDLYGMGPAGAARVVADVGDIARFPTKARFAAWTGTAPLDASSGAQLRHRLSRAGNRRLNHVLHIMAIVQVRHDTPGRAYYRRLLARGKTPMEALRVLKRRLSDVVYRQMVADQRQRQAERAGPGGHPGATLESSADDLHTPMVVSSDQSQPGPATTHDRTEPVDGELLDRDQIDQDAAGDGRRASAGAGPSLPTIALTRARRGSTVNSGPQGRRTATRSAVEGGGTGPYARGAANHRAAAPTRTGGAAATAVTARDQSQEKAPANPLP